MANQPLFTVTDTVSNLTTGLTDGASYTAQHVGGQPVQYCNAATDPTSADVGWNVMANREYIIFEVDLANPVWVRTKSIAGLAISDA